MKKNTLKMDYYNTYYFANVINNVVEDSFSYIRTLDDFLNNSNYHIFLEAFPRYSALHCFIEFCIERLDFESIDKLDIDDFVQKDSRLWIEDALAYHKIPHINFKKWLSINDYELSTIIDDNIFEYYQYLRDESIYDLLIEQLVNEVFFVLFMNRKFLHNFVNIISSTLSMVTLEELHPDDRVYFKRDGMLKRASIPTWVQKAVFFRDRGTCTICTKDISGLVNIGNQKHFDHIIPLALSGINDVSNIQLLCAECNLSKKDRNTNTSYSYEKWY